MEQVRECLSRGNAWVKRAPLILTFASKPDLDCQIRGRDYYPLGIGLAVENLLLQGIHLGLVTHPIAGFNEVKVREALDIPQEYIVHVLVIVGYPGSPEGLDTSVMEDEKKPWERKALDEIIFWEKWK